MSVTSLNMSLVIEFNLNIIFDHSKSIIIGCSNSEVVMTLHFKHPGCGFKSGLNYVSLRSWNLHLSISEGCFIFDFASLPLKVAQPIYPTMCTKVAIKHQSKELPPGHIYPRCDQARV